MGGIDPDSRRAFPWDEARWDAELLASMQAVFAVRHAEPALRSDEVHVVAIEGAGLSFRRGPGGELAIALNPGDEPVRLPLGEGGAGSVLVAAGRARSVDATVVVADGALAVDLPPRSGVVIRPA